MITRQSFYRPIYAASGSVPTFSAPKPHMAQAAVLPRDVSARFGRRLRQLRKDRHMTQMQVATVFGIDRSFLSDLERGRKSLSLSTLEIFALGFNITLSELLAEI